MTDGVPLISIITVTKDNLAGLTRTAKNVQVQTFTDYQWIIVDGLSQDGTAEYLETLEGATIIRGKDDGIYDAMNKGIDAAKGEYLIFMNAGDVFGDRYVLGTISEDHLEEVRPDFLYGDAMEGEGFYKKAIDHKNIAWGMITHHQAMVYRRDKIKKMRYDTSLKIAADYGFTVRFLRNADKIHYLPAALCLFEDGGISQQNQKQGRVEQFSVRRGTGTPSAYNALIRTLSGGNSLLESQSTSALLHLQVYLSRKMKPAYQKRGQPHSSDS